MADYKGIKGYSVQKLASDPGTLSEVVGQLWYNSSSNTWKISANVTGAWASGGAMTRSNGDVNVNGTGSQTATIAAGGYAPSYYTYSESYNGSTWTATSALNAARYETGMAGNLTAAICIAGATETAPTLYETAAAETWNGSTWTSITDITTRRGSLAGSGSTTAALGAAGNYGTGGAGPSWGFSVLVEQWNGASWTEVGDVNNARNYICQAAQGTTTASMINGGSPLAGVGYKTETYNGTAWTEVADSNNPREHGGGFGNATNAMAFGGYTPAATNLAESWNGIAWTAEAVMASAVIGPGGSGSGSAGIAVAGSDTPSGTTGLCEEWVGGIMARTVTTS